MNKRNIADASALPAILWKFGILSNQGAVPSAGAPRRWLCPQPALPVVLCAGVTTGLTLLGLLGVIAPALARRGLQPQYAPDLGLGDAAVSTDGFRRSDVPGTGPARHCLGVDLDQLSGFFGCEHLLILVFCHNGACYPP